MQVSSKSLDVLVSGGICLCLCASLRAQGIPEPPLIFYGTIRNAAQNNLRMTSGSLSWQVRKVSTGRTIGLSTIVSNYPGFSYVLEVPAETIISGPVSSNALDLTAATNAFDRAQVFYNGAPVIFALPMQSTFSASSRQRGRIERIDFTVSIPCVDDDGNGLCDDWELRYFGFIGLDPNADDDGDGMRNRAEYQAGSDPNNKGSAFQFIHYQALADGAMQVDWESADGRLYRLWRGTNVVQLLNASSLTLVRSNLVATPPLNTFIDSNTVPAGPYFYRLELEQ